MATKKEPRISWQVEEYSHREKSTDWYWALGIIAITGAAISIIYGNVMFAILIVIGSILLGYFAVKEPEILLVEISEDGINVNNIFYPFTKIKGFAVEEHPLGSKLILETSRTIVPVISIPLPDDLDPEALESLLETRLVKKHLEEPTSHRIMEQIGF